MSDPVLSYGFPVYAGHYLYGQDILANPALCTWVKPEFTFRFDWDGCEYGDLNIVKRASGPVSYDLNRLWNCGTLETSFADLKGPWPAWNDIIAVLFGYGPGFGQIFYAIAEDRPPWIPPTPPVIVPYSPLWTIDISPSIL